MKRSIPILTVLFSLAFLLACTFSERDDHDAQGPDGEESAEAGHHEEDNADRLARFRAATGLRGTLISYGPIIAGEAPADFEQITGSPYKPSRNEDPAIPPQCWIETGYGTQNACKYCHTDYLTRIELGNAFPLGEDQILYSFPTPNLNRVNWRNVTHPDEIVARLEAEGVKVPTADDPENLAYVRQDNWTDAYRKARPNGEDAWNNLDNEGAMRYPLMPALDPNDLYPYVEKDPTGGGAHGYVDRSGFVRDRKEGYTGWRAVNFFPYAIFTPLTGSVSGIYIRLPEIFRTEGGAFSKAVYAENLDLVEWAVKDLLEHKTHYRGDAGKIPVTRGFYPVGTEFAHPLHYVDLAADGECGEGLDGLADPGPGYEFPGTRSKRVKEIRYMYKWRAVGLDDIADHEDDEHGDEPPTVIGREWKGYIDNDAGWILAGFIEDRKGRLRAQTTEELLQCKGCHGAVGNTVDSVWSFQRKLPGSLGWRENDYGRYGADHPERTKLSDYVNPSTGRGELEEFYATVVGGDLFGVLPGEIEEELIRYVRSENLSEALELKHELTAIFDDEALKSAGRDFRRSILEERSRIMRRFAEERAYLAPDPVTGDFYLKGNLFYPLPATAKANIAGYRRIVLDQSFNLGKNAFGMSPDTIPFTFRSDGTIRNAAGEIIPRGGVIDSRPFDEDGVGFTPTLLVAVDGEGRPVDEAGNLVDLEKNPQAAKGHRSRGGTFDTLYSPILSGEKVTPGKR